MYMYMNEQGFEVVKKENRVCFSNEEYWMNVWKDILNKRTKDERIIEKNNFMGLASHDQMISLKLRNLEKNMLAEKMGFKTGGFVMNSDNDIYYVVGASISGGDIRSYGMHIALYPVDDINKFDVESLGNLYLSPNLIRAYPSGITLYGIDESRNRYENYYPVELEYKEIVNQKEVEITQSKSSLIEKKKRLYSNDEYWESVRSEIESLRTNKEIELQRRYDNGELISYEEGFGVVYSLRKKEKSIFSEKMGYKIGSFVKNLNSDVFYIVDISFGGMQLSPKNAVLYLYKVKSIADFVPDDSINYKTKKLTFAFSSMKEVRGLIDEENRYEYYFSVNDIESYEIGDKIINFAVQVDVI